MTAPPINLTQLRAKQTIYLGTEVRISKDELDALIDTAEAALDIDALLEPLKTMEDMNLLALNREGQRSLIQLLERLRESVARYTSRPTGQPQ